MRATHATRRHCLESMKKSTKRRDVLADSHKTFELRLGTECSQEENKKKTTTMTDIVPLARSAGVKNPALNLFQVPLTDLSMTSYCMVPIHPFTTGINPIDFQIDPQEDYVDLSRSYFKIELRLQKAAGAGNVVAAENTFLVNNIAHSLFKQISV